MSETEGKKALTTLIIYSSNNTIGDRNDKLTQVSLVYLILSSKVAFPYASTPHQYTWSFSYAIQFPPFLPGYGRDRILVAANESCNDGAELTRGKRPNCGVSPLLELLVPGQDLYLDSPFAAPLHRPGQSSLMDGYMMAMADEELYVHGSSGSAGSTNSRLRALAQLIAL
uniref:Uncharacterized protein n=1 Tax=Aegilops tauschii TaxID=37682 RepID=R7WGG6_AEGTA